MNAQRLLLKSEELLTCDYCGTTLMIQAKALVPYKMIDGYSLCVPCVRKYAQEKAARIQGKLF